MKKHLTVVFIALFTTLTTVAQHHRPMERIHAAKMAYITDRLHLSTEQSGSFIPLYNEFEKEIRSTRQFFFRKYIGADLRDADDETSRQVIDDNLDYQEKIIEIKRRYNDQFLKIITPQQLTELYKAEREFKQMLIKRLDRHPHLPHRVGGRFNNSSNDY